MDKFKFEIGKEATISCSQEKGRIIGRAQYERDENSYYIIYQAADGRAVTKWWPESAIV